MKKVQTIICPKCEKEIPLDNILTHKIEEEIRKDFEKRQQENELELKKKEESIKKREEGLETKINERIEAEKSKIKTQVESDLKKENADELNFLKEELSKKEQTLSEVRKESVELRKEKAKLADEKAAFELEKEKQLEAERENIKEEAHKQFSEEHQLKDAEKDKKLQDAIKMNEELKRKLQQGSQQTQGEVLELGLEDNLKTEFPFDVIEPVPKGIKGADVIQKVHTKTAKFVGTIIWESKHTKTWSDGWISKLKNDQRTISAELAVLVTEVLPNDIKSFDFRDGIWITDYRSAIGLATALRSQLTQVATTKMAAVGKNEKMEVLYNYLSGTEFKHKIEAIVEAFVGMKEDLDKEKRTFDRIWAKREKQISQVVTSTASMYGDMQGLIGSSMQSIPALEAGVEEENEDQKEDSKGK